MVDGSEGSITKVPSAPSSPLPLCNHAPCARPTIHPSPNPIEPPRRNPNTWDPLTRYYSGKNSIPDYGMPRENIMSKIKTKLGSGVGAWHHGNWLDSSPATKPDSQPSFKRPGDPSSPRPTKRSRHNESGEQPDVVVIDSTPKTAYTPRRSSVNSHNRPGGSDCRESLSAKSGDGESKRLGLNEYRATTKNITGKKRSRHKKAAERALQGQPPRDQDGDMVQRTGAGFSVKRRLMSGHEIPSDRIEDDHGLAAPEHRPRLQDLAQATRNGTFTAEKLYPLPSSDEDTGQDNDEDEIAELPPAKQHKIPAQHHKTRVFEQTNNGKRPSNGPDELQLTHVAKRRAMPASAADIPRTNFVSSSTTSVPRAKGICLRVEAAACDQSFIYPASRGMKEDAPGAANQKCYLMATSDSPQVLHSVDENGAGLDELEWMVPNISGIKQIQFSNNLPIIKISKSIDYSTKFATGAILVIKFGTNKEALQFVRLCQVVNSGIKVHNPYGYNLISTLETMTVKIRDRNIKNAARPRPPETQVPVPQATGTKGPSLPPRKADPPPTASSGHYAQAKALRMRMRVDDGLETDPAGVAVTAGEEKSLRKFLENEVDSCVDSQNGEAEKERPAHRLASSSKEEQREPTHHSQRSLRSSRFEPRSPSPPPQRWTEKNPNWKTELNYKIPLIYERTTITATDIERLDEGQFLNDEIISFYAKYLHKQLERKDEQLAKRIYIFSSFFWDTLKSKGYDGVKNWTAKVDLLSFDYIIVPINQSTHWYLAIICKPGGLLPRERSASPQSAALANGHGSASGNLGDGHGHGDQHPDDEKVQIITSDIDNDPAKDRTNGSQTSRAGHDDRPSTGKKTKGPRRSIGPRKYSTNDPRVITLDSLDGSHTGVSTALKHYLKEEIKNRKGIDIEVPSLFGMTAKDIPIQNNFTDCGVYLLGYIEEFMKDPDEFTKGILQHEKRDWNVDAPALRKKIRDLILKLHKNYQQEDLRKRRERAEQKRAKSHTPAAETAPINATKTKSTASERPPVATPAAEDRSKSHTATAQQTQSAARSVASVAPSRQSPPHPSQSMATTQTTKQRSHARPDREQVSPPPVQRQQTSASQTDEHKSHDVNVSMIVNPNESVEIVEQPSHSQERVTPPIIQSVESRDEAATNDDDDDDDASSTTSSSSSSDSNSVASSTAAEEGSQRPREMSRGMSRRDNDETRMLQALASSSPPRAVAPKEVCAGKVSQPTTASHHSSAPAAATTSTTTGLTKLPNPPSGGQKSRFFLSPSFRHAGASHPGPAEYATVPSSSSEDEMSRKAQHKEKQSQRQADKRQETKRHVVDLT